MEIFDKMYHDLNRPTGGILQDIPEENFVETAILIFIFLRNDCCWKRWV